MGLIKRTITYTNVKYIFMHDFRNNADVNIKVFAGNVSLNKINSDLYELHGCDIIIIEKIVKTEIFKMSILDFMYYSEKITNK